MSVAHTEDDVITRVTGTESLAKQDDDNCKLGNFKFVTSPSCNLQHY